MVATLLALVLVLAALAAPLIAPYDPFDPASLDLMDGFSRPMQPNEITGKVFWLGTDEQGRDVFSAILYGLRDLAAGRRGLGVVLAGTSASRSDSSPAMSAARSTALIMRIADVQLTFPAILIALLVYGVAKSVFGHRLQTP